MLYTNQVILVVLLHLRKSNNFLAPSSTSSTFKEYQYNLILRLKLVLKLSLLMPRTSGSL